MSNASNIFLQIAHKVIGMGDLHQVIEEQEGKMELLCFRISSLPPQQAISTYHRIQNKQIFTDPKIQATMWYGRATLGLARIIKTPIRLVYCVLHAFDEQKLIKGCNNATIQHQIDFPSLSPFFFHKHPHFLQFHFLAMLKVSEKISWNSDRDDLVLAAMRVQGMRWNEVSRMIFLQTNREVFLPPKNCRERWLNHLDTTKLKGSWQRTEDILIFEHIVETSSKKWSKMVQLLGGRRSEHSIKNRFNTLIAKNKKYKSEKELNVATRILTWLRSNIEGQAYNYNEKQEQSEGRLIVVRVSPDQKRHPQSLKEQACQQDMVSYSVQMPNPVDEAPLVRESPAMAKEEEGEGIQAQMAQFVCEEVVMDGIYPFQNYSYQQDMYKYTPQIFDFHQAHLIYYQPVFALALPTADTATREAKFLQERRRQNASSQ